MLQYLLLELPMLQLWLLDCQCFSCCAGAAGAAVFIAGLPMLQLLLLELPMLQYLLLELAMMQLLFLHCRC